MSESDEGNKLSLSALSNFAERNLFDDEKDTRISSSEANSTQPITKEAAKESGERLARTDSIDNRVIPTQDLRPLDQSAPTKVSKSQPSKDPISQSLASS
jgi:hypothetical protein